MGSVICTRSGGPQSGTLRQRSSVCKEINYEVFTSSSLPLASVCTTATAQHLRHPLSCRHRVIALLRCAIATARYPVLTSTSRKPRNRRSIFNTHHIQESLAARDNMIAKLFYRNRKEGVMSGHKSDLYVPVRGVSPKVGLAEACTFAFVAI